MRANYRPIVYVFRQMSSQSKDKNIPKTKDTAKQSKTSPKTETVGTPTATSSGQIDDGTYRSPEYYSHNTNTFYDYFIDMTKYRLKQPSNKS